MTTIIIIGWLVTLAGWITTHQLSLRAQRENLLHQVYNSARVEITQAIREFQDWHSRVSILIRLLPDPGLPATSVPAHDWMAKHSEMLALSGDRRAYRWIFLLEEYEILFPATRDVRLHLCDRQRELIPTLSDLPLALASPQDRDAGIKKAKSLLGPLMDMAALLEDLRVYLQNTTLHTITGNKVPYRQPRDPTVPRIVENERGGLEIVPKRAG